MALEPDIVDKVRNDFGPDKSEQALELLRELGDSEFTMRCLIVLSRGSLDALRANIQMSEDDWRHVTRAKYDSADQLVRDLRVSFLLDTPEKLWVGEVADMMARRGYRLSSVTGRVTNVPPFQYTADYVEGRATFVGPDGQVEIDKKGRRWRILGDPAELERFNMARDFDDDGAFRDAVSGYLLVRRRPNP